jgi:hypothetical protein
MALQWHFKHNRRLGALRNAIIKKRQPEERVARTTRIWRMRERKICRRTKSNVSNYIRGNVCVLHAEMTINARTKSSISLFCALLCSAPPFRFFYFPLATVPLGETFLFNSLYFSAVRAHSPFLLLDLSYAAYHGEFSRAASREGE